MRAFTFALPLIMACASPGDLPLRVPAPQSADPPAAAGQDSVIQARVGEEFAITLPSNPSTGHRWMLADSLAEGMLRLVDRTYVPQQPVMPGSGGHERFTFAALAPGETTIWLRYARGGQASAPREAVFRVRIRPVDR